MTPQVGRVIDTLIDVAGRLGRTPAQVAMAWCLRLPVVNAVIIGADTPERVAENFAAADWQLPASAERELSTAAAGQRLVVRKDAPDGYREP